MNGATKKLLHSKHFETRWGDMDAYGHMNNTMYFFYLQEARFEFLKENNIQINLRGIAPVLAGTSCKFIRPIFYPESIIVETWLVSYERKKTIFEHIIKSASKNEENKQEIIYAVAEALIVWYDFSKSMSVLPPEAMQKLFS
jgi:acyl-CoA thioester hydrolase